MLFRRRRGGTLAGEPGAAGPGPEQRIGTRFVMRQKMFSFGDDFTVTDERGRKLYKIQEKLLRVRDSVSTWPAATASGPRATSSTTSTGSPAATGRWRLSPSAGSGSGTPTASRSHPKRTPC